MTILTPSPAAVPRGHQQQPIAFGRDRVARSAPARSPRRRTRRAALDQRAPLERGVHLVCGKSGSSRSSGSLMIGPRYARGTPHRHRRRRRDRQRHRVRSRWAIRRSAARSPSSSAIRPTRARRPRCRRARSASSSRPPINIEIGRFGIEFLRRVGDELAVDGERARRRARRARLPVPRVRDRTRARSRATMRCSARTASTSPCSTRRRCAQRFPWLVDRRPRDRIARPARRGLVRRLQPAAGVPAQGAVARRALRAGEASGFDVEARASSRVRLADGARIAGDAFVNAAGPWAASVARWLDIELPVRARRRCVFGFTCPTPIARCPLVIDPTGAVVPARGRPLHLRDLARRGPTIRTTCRSTSTIRCSTTCSGRRSRAGTGVRGAATVAAPGPATTSSTRSTTTASSARTRSGELRSRQRLLGSRPAAGACGGACASPNCSSMAATGRST